LEVVELREFLPVGVDVHLATPVEEHINRPPPNCSEPPTAAERPTRCR
jgi:hypothetical protein